MSVLRGLVFCLLGAMALAAATPQKYTYWVQPCARASAACQPGDPQLADWALEAWQRAAGGALEFTEVSDPAKARIKLYWATAELGLYGETRPVDFHGQVGAEVYVLTAPLRTKDDPLLRDAIVYLTCLHESGHALGLSHTADFADIMYSFQFGGDIDEYFGRYRRKLATRGDIEKNSGMSARDRQRLLAILAN
ncbi:MAG TPA: matrixin family metalloprotease [Bryobacteraceae bacterium]|nr:matrixin family metalloprotease [Bryobacteraceae bacterium]